MWTRAQLKQNAKEKLRKYYWSGFLVSLIYSFIGGSTGFTGSWKMNDVKDYDFSSVQDSMIEEGNQIFEYSHEIPTVLVLLFLAVAVVAVVAAFAFTIFLVNPIRVGVSRFFLLSGERKTEISEILFAFHKGRYGNVVKVMFFKELYTFLWSLLFVIPGIIKGYEYSMIPYLLAENPEMNKEQAFRLTYEMTSGNKGRIFVLDLSFFGWLFLGALACGVGTLFVQPYIMATYVELFLALKAGIYYNRQNNQTGSNMDFQTM